MSINIKKIKGRKKEGAAKTIGNLFLCLNTVPHVMGHVLSSGKQSLVRVLFLISKTYFISPELELALS